MRYAIQIIAARMPGDVLLLTKESGRFILACDVAAMHGIEPIPTARTLGEAATFASKGEATTFWMTQSRVRPLRPDGEPNRPLTAFTVEIVPVPEAVS